jgi:hypothetical protein
MNPARSRQPAPLRYAAVSLIAALLCSGLLLAQDAGAERARGGASFESGGTVGNGAGGSEKVKASEIRCKRAKRLARKFIRKDQIRRGWKVTNPAGCEFLMFRKRDADEFGPVPKPKPDLPLIFFTKTVGCVS